MRHLDENKVRDHGVYKTIGQCWGWSFEDKLKKPFDLDSVTIEDLLMSGKA